MINRKKIQEQNLNHVAYAGQDNYFVANLNVRQNIILGNEFIKNKILIDWKRNSNRLKKLMQKYNIFVDLNKKISYLTLIEQRQVAILRALYKNPKILLLDEPTVGLTYEQKLILVKIFRSFIEDKITVIFSTRDYEFAQAVANRYAVLKKQTIVEIVSNKIKKNAKIDYFDWRKIITNKRSNATLNNELIFYLEDLNINTKNYQFLSNIDISVRKGEIVGIYDPKNIHGTLIGDVIIGKIFDKATRIFYENQNISSYNQKQRYNLGIDLVVENFLQDGLIKNYSLADNFILWHHSRKEFTIGGILKQSEINFKVKNILEDYKISKFISFDTLTNNLSNGELQKFTIARTLELGPKFVVLINPFDHLDLESTKLIINKIIKHNNDGMSFLIISADPYLLQAICHRIDVVYEGKIINEVNFIEQDLIEYQWKPIFEKMFQNIKPFSVKNSLLKSKYLFFKVFINKIKTKFTGG